MEKKKLDLIISIIREQMAANPPGGSGGFSGSADPKGPTAGYDAPIKRKKFIYGGVGSRKKWLTYLKSKDGGRS